MPLPLYQRLSGKEDWNFLNLNAVLPDCSRYIIYNTSFFFKTFLEGVKKGIHSLHRGAGSPDLGLLSSCPPGEPLISPFPSWTHLPRVKILGDHTERMYSENSIRWSA